MNQYSNTELIADMKRRPSLSREDNDRLYNEVKANVPNARDRMVEGNMYLVVEKVECFIRRHSNAAHLRDDLTSAGCYGLIVAVDAIASGTVDNTNITGYLAVCIGREFETMMDTENPIYINGRTRRYARARGKPLVFPVFEPLPSDRDKHYDPNQKEELADNEKQPAGSSECYEQSGMTDLRDLLTSCCETDDERAFVRMREAHYTYQEIADALDIPKGSIPALKSRLYARYLRKTEMQKD